MKHSKVVKCWFYNIYVTINYLLSGKPYSTFTQLGLSGISYGLFSVYRHQIEPIIKKKIYIFLNRHRNRMIKRIKTPICWQFIESGGKPKKNCLIFSKVYIYFSSEYIIIGNFRLEIGR